MKFKQFIEEAYAQKKIDTLAKQLARMTDENDHNGALLLLAKQLNNGKYIEVMEGIIKIHNAYSSMPSELIKLRNKTYDDLMKLAKKKYSKEDFQKIYSSF
jgi:uncharacterized protein HemY